MMYVVINDNFSFLRRIDVFTGVGEWVDDVRLARSWHRLANAQEAARGLGRVMYVDPVW